MATLAERVPLLREGGHAQTDVLVAHSRRQLLQVSRYVNANLPWLMSVRNTIQWVITAFTVSGSYFYLRTSWKMFTPKCWEYELKLHSFACHTTGLCFWTFPLLCVMIVIITFWRHLYESRLYYECLLHRILMNYDNEATFQSPVTWTFMIYGLLAVSVIWFAHPSPLDDKPLIMGLIVYTSPLVSFFMVFMGLWQVEGQLIPLPKFYEADPKLAQEVLSQSVYATDKCLRVAFEEVEEALARKESAEAMTSGKYFDLLFEAIKTETSKSMKSRKLDVEENCTDRFLARLGMERVDEYGYGDQASRPEFFTWAHALRKRDWWVHRLLFSQHFKDERAVSFRSWARAHNIFASLCFLCVLEVYISTITDWFKDQRAHFAD